ncbi:MAG: c-type cytochrome biogenesis protein CcsB [Candidatus Omnitrophota bacterium]
MIGYAGLIFDWAFVSSFASGLFYVLYFMTQWLSWRRLGYFMVIVALCMLSAVLALRFAAARSFAVFGLYESMIFFSWLIVSIYLIVARRTGNSVNAIFVLPLVAVLLGFAKFIDNAVRPLPPALRSHWLGIHVTFCFLGYACFVLAFCFAVLYLWQERELKSRKVDRYFFRLPSVGLLDSLGYKMIAFGFVFLSLGIISGSVWAQRAWGSFWSWDPKETWSLIMWLVYLVYLHGRLTRGWKGRKSAYIAILGFIIMLFTYLGVSFLLPGMHSYL